MSWVSLTVDLPAAASEQVQAVLLDHGAAGLELREPADRLMPGVRAPAQGQAIVIGYFEARDGAEAAARELERALAGLTAAIEPVAEKDWSVEWRSQIRSVTVGRLWVGPPWERAQAPADRVCLFIEPKMAFGTGDHPTTSLCLAAVDGYLAAHPGASVLDVGTGTGVLALAARRLGAGRTVGVDTDPVSVQLARECAAENGIAGVDFSGATLDAVTGRFDLVLANILANTLVELAPAIAAKVADRLVLAGVLVPQADEVSQAYLAQGLTAGGQAVEGEWVRLDFVRPR